MRAQQRRSDTMPTSWELPALIAVGFVMLAILAIPASAALVDGLRWPQNLGSISDEVFTGKARPEEYVALIGLEAVVALVGVFAALVWWHAAGPGAQVGLASRREVRRTLGPHALRRRRAGIRPDLRRR
jgi:hypothetical protein